MSKSLKKNRKLASKAAKMVFVKIIKDKKTIGLLSCNLNLSPGWRFQTAVYEWKGKKTEKEK